MLCHVSCHVSCVKHQITINIKHLVDSGGQATGEGWGCLTVASSVLILVDVYVCMYLCLCVCTTSNLHNTTPPSQSATANHHTTQAPPRPTPYLALTRSIAILHLHTVEDGGSGYWNMMWNGVEWVVEYDAEWTEWRWWAVEWCGMVWNGVEWVVEWCGVEGEWVVD